MNHSGIVNRLEGKVAIVTMAPSSACEGCNSCGKGSEEQEVRVYNDQDAQVGDYVEFDMEIKNLLSAAFLAYGLPLVVMVSSIALATKLFTWLGYGNIAELIGVLTGFASVTLTYFAIKYYENKIKDSTRFMAKLIRVSKKPNQEVFLNVEKEM